MDGAIEQRAAVHAALGDPVRLAIVEDLAVSDRAPSALAARFGQGSNLMTHHLDVLERVGLIERHVSSGDRRRRYVRLRHGALRELTVPLGRRPAGRALFVCTHNSARSQLAAALWRQRTGAEAASAGTHPADRVHPGAVAAGRRAGLDLAGARPRALAPDDLDADVVVTVCDRAHEELDASEGWLHWSIPDPVEAGDRRAFDRALGDLDLRVTDLADRTAIADESVESTRRDHDQRMTAATPDPEPSPGPAPGPAVGARRRRPAVLFLCVHNAGRSQMAAGWLRHLAGDAVDVFSGGSDPGARTNPAAVAAMAEVGIDISAERPEPWTDEIARAADVIVTMGCGDACPVYPGTRYEDWELTDPAGQPVEVVRAVRDEIHRRVRRLMSGLDVPARA